MRCLCLNDGNKFLPAEFDFSGFEKAGQEKEGKMEQNPSVCISIV